MRMIRVTRVSCIFKWWFIHRVYYYIYETKIRNE